MVMRPRPPTNRPCRRSRRWTSPLDKVGFIILKAREFDVKEEDSDPDEGSNPTDDGNADVLEDKADDPVREELLGAIRGLNEDERADWWRWPGWAAAPTTWKNGTRRWPRRAANTSKRAAEYLLGLPLLGDYLEDGLAMFDEGIVDDDDTRRPGRRR